VEEMSQTIQEKLKTDVLNAVHDVKDSRKLFLETKELLRKKEIEYRKAKTINNKAYNIWKRARRIEKRCRGRLSSFPSRSRRWAKDNMGKVLNNFLEEGDEVG
jgi:hypothetical protein